jgi:hypothetical protein
LKLNLKTKLGIINFEDIIVSEGNGTGSITKKVLIVEDNKINML